MIRWLALMCIVLGVALAGAARGESFLLNNGEELNGEAMGPTVAGVIIKKVDGAYTPRIGWTNFSQSALQKLFKALPPARRYIEPLLEDPDPPEIKPRATAEKIPFTAPFRLDRPSKTAGFGDLFSSGFTLTLLFLLYAANIYAGYEISLFRNYPPAMVCGLAAVAPVIGPAIFLCIPTRIPPEVVDESQYVPPEEPELLQVEGAAPPPPPPPPPGAAPGRPVLPPPIVYQRGTTTFNRRFFETKMAGFMRMVPGEEEKDMVICIKSARGEYVGQRISKVQPNELYLQVVKGGASQDIIIPYNELFEVKIRHKDDV